MKLVRNKRTKAEYYLSDKDIEAMKEKKLFGNFTIIKEIKDMESTEPPLEVVDFMKSLKKVETISDKQELEIEAQKEQEQEQPKPKTNTKKKDANKRTKRSTSSKSTSISESEDL